MKLKTAKSGQGMTEYIIIIAVIAIGCLLIAGLFGKQIKGVFSREGAALSGKDDAAESTAAAASLKAEAQKTDSMNSFDKDAAKGQE
jgi:Flp pilus assembly pilin Flp